MKVLVVVGTHEQQFDRLVNAADQLSLSGHEVFVQYGASGAPSSAAGEPLVDRTRLDRLMDEADVIITHGGPGTIWQAFEHGKHPIVVPRRRSFGEHVDDHQLAFARRLAASRRVVLVDEIDQLPTALRTHPTVSATLKLPQHGVSANRLAVKRKLDLWLLGSS